MKREEIRRAFRKLAYEEIRVRPEGFEIRDAHYPELVGRVREVSLTRKRFEDGSLACLSLDGVHGSEGQLCETCANPSCPPRLRVELLVEPIVYVLELNVSSARNFFRIEDEAKASGRAIGEWLLELSVVSHGRWAEVHFRRSRSGDTS